MHAFTGNVAPQPVAHAAPLHPAPVQVAPPARDALRSATQSVEAAKAAVQVAQKNRDRAADMVATARAQVRDAQAVEHKVVTWKIHSVKNSTTEELPDELRGARHAGLLAEADLTHAQTVESTMVGELEAAKRALLSAETAKADAINRLVIESMSKIADEIVQLTSRKKYLRSVLRGASVVGREAEEVSRRGLDDVYAAELAFPTPQAGAISYWKHYADSLASNPEASLGEPPADEDLWR